MDGTQGFQKLMAWKRADELALHLFQVSREIAKTDRWLASQLSRAAISVPANIAEGYGRGSLGDYMRFLEIARGSLAEVEYYIHFLQRTDLINAVDAERANVLREEAGRLLGGLWRSLKAKSPVNWDHSGSQTQLRIREEYETYEVEV